MNKAVVGLLVAVVLFGTAAGGSWFLQQKMRAEGEAAHGAADGHDKAGKVLPSPVAHHPGTIGDGKSLKPGIRPPLVPESDSVSKMAVGLQQQAEALKNREQLLTARQKNLELICEDIRKQQKLIDEARKQLDDELKELTDRLGGLEKKAADTRLQDQKLAEQLRQIKKSLFEVDEVERAQLKKMGKAYDTIEPEAAAQHLLDMMDTGQLDLAAKLLAGMQDRQMSRVLAALPGPAVVQLLERFKGLKTSSAKGP